MRVLEDVVGVAGWVIAGLVAWVLVAGLCFSLFVRRARRVLGDGDEPRPDEQAADDPLPRPRAEDDPSGSGTAA